jgi:hypothetical protein
MSKCTFVTVVLLMSSSTIAWAQPPAAPSSPAAASSASGAPVAEIDAVAYDNLRKNASQMLDAVKSLGNSFVIYQSQLFSKLPLYYPALREADGVRQTLCGVRNVPPPHSAELSVTTTLDIGGALSGLAAILALFKPSLTIAALELPPADQALIADFASAALGVGKTIYVPGAMAPNLEPTNPLATDICLAVNLEEQDPGVKNPSISQEWQAADTVAMELWQKLSNWTSAQLSSPAGKSIKDALDAYATILKKQTTTDAGGNSPLATYIAAGRLKLILETRKPLVLVLGVDDIGGTGWVKSKAFTVPVTYSGGASSHYYVFSSGSVQDSHVVAAGTVTSLDTALDQKSLTKIKLGSALDNNRILLGK